MRQGITTEFLEGVPAEVAWFAVASMATHITELAVSLGVDISDLRWRFGAGDDHRDMHYLDATVQP